MSVHDPNSKYEKLRLTKRHEALLFDSVLETYVKARLTQPISAIDYCPDSRPFKWTPVLAEFIADVQSATEVILCDSHDQQGIWHTLSLRVAVEMGATGLPEPKVVSAKDAQAVAQKCARIYHARGLEPKQYFTRIKRRAEDRP
jgi:hypothetical protein